MINIIEWVTRIAALHTGVYKGNQIEPCSNVEIDTRNIKTVSIVQKLPGKFKIIPWNRIRSCTTRK